MKGAEKEQITIVYAANDRYIPYMGVSISSLIQHASGENFYRIYILSEEVSQHHRKRILEMAKGNIEIEFVDITERMKDRNIPTVNHLSKETTYRLLIDKIFRGYSKILYIDSDTIINKDVAELYAEDMDGYILGCSRASLCYGLASYIKEKLKLPLKNYFNAGILLINVPMFHEYQIGKKCFGLLQSGKKYMTVDQDVLNITCQNQVKFIDGRWNVEWEFITGKGKEIVIDETREGKTDYLKDPYIIHYTSPFKPWVHPENELSEYFWASARKTLFYEEILFSNINVKSVQQDSFQRFVFPWKLVRPDSRIIMYGAGVVGRAFYNQIKMSQYCCIKAICDRDYQNIIGFGIPVIAKEEICGYEFDVVVIAIEKEETAAQVRQDLENAGIPSDKIVWDIYKRK